MTSDDNYIPDSWEESTKEMLDDVDLLLQDATVESLLWAMNQTQKTLRKLHDAKVTLGSIKDGLQEDNQRMLEWFIDELQLRLFRIEQRVSFIGGFE
jgi:hypothetical protein